MDRRDADDPAILLELMHDATAVDIRTAVAALQRAPEDLKAFVLANTDLTLLQKDVIAEIGMNSVDVRVKDLALMAMKTDAKPPAHRYYSGAALLLVMEPTPDNLQNWLEFHSRSVSSPGLILRYVLNRVMERISGAWQLEAHQELTLLRAMAHTYKPHQEKFWEQLVGMAYDKFALRHDSPYHQKAWHMVLGGKNGFLRPHHLDEIIKQPDKMRPLHVGWMIEAWARHPKAPQFAIQMPDTEDFGKAYPTLYNQYCEIINMIRIMK